MFELYCKRKNYIPIQFESIDEILCYNDLNLEMIDSITRVFLNSLKNYNKQIIEDFEVDLSLILNAIYPEKFCLIYPYTDLCKLTDIAKENRAINKTIKAYEDEPKYISDNFIKHTYSWNDEGRFKLFANLHKAPQANIVNLLSKINQLVPGEYDR